MATYLCVARNISAENSSIKKWINFECYRISKCIFRIFKILKMKKKINTKAHWEPKSRLLQREREMELGTRYFEQKDIKSIKNNCKHFVLFSPLIPLNFFMAQQWRVNCSCLHFKRVSLDQNCLLLYSPTRESSIRKPSILKLKSIHTFNYLHWAVNSDSVQWAWHVWKMRF